ncbi:MAG TPA: hypothetical protein VKI20_10545 [Acidimicrobiales bacterium]|nr:hypothetical protein [Acidimicrobiales bacterium]
MAKRLLALLAAAAMVAGAVLARDRIRSSGGETSRPRLTCATELATVCTALEDRAIVTVEPAGTTAQRLAGVAAGADPGLDGWLALQPWPALVDNARSRAAAPTLFASSAPAPVARSPLTVAIWPDRLRVAQTACGNTPVTWKCLGTVAGRGAWSASGGSASWGLVKPALPDPVVNGAGLDVLAALAVGFTSRNDLLSTDLDDDAFRSFFDGVARAVPTSPPSLETMVAVGPAVLDLFATVEAAAARPVAVSVRSPKPVIVYPSPLITADVVIATLSTQAGRTLTSLIGSDPGQRALAASGWRVGGGQAPSDAAASAAPPGPPPLPPTPGLPAPGVMDSLRQAWKEARG